MDTFIGHQDIIYNESTRNKGTLDRLNNLIKINY
jgi:hypothetical protein